MKLLEIYNFLLESKATEMQGMSILRKAGIEKAYRLSNASNPKALLPILGDDTIAYIKQEIANGSQNLVSHLLNNANNHDDMEDIFDEYGIEHGHISKYYTRKK